MSLQSFSAWLANTQASFVIQTTTGLIPAVQTIHILCVAIVISAVLLVHLNTLGIAMRGYTGAQLATRLLPGLWWAVLVLLTTGSILIVAEPGRSLPNSMFQLKMLLLIVAITLTLLYQMPLRKEASHWEATPARRLSARAIAIVSLIVWICIVFAGRWIAYT